MKEITIVADTNDADYITSVNQISEDDLEAIKPLIIAIKGFKPYKTKYKHSWDNSTAEWTHTHNWTEGECRRKDLGEKSPKELYGTSVDEDTFDLFCDLLPCWEYGIHTITSIHVSEVSSKEQLL